MLFVLTSNGKIDIAWLTREKQQRLDDEEEEEEMARLSSEITVKGRYMIYMANL
jgi:hypothetical protein